ncbi:MAG TPA: hypothetical protein VIM55_18670 [Mucilaginibacter sp.]
MKRLFAIVLLSIHLFNIGGYALLFQYYIHKSDVQMVKEIFDNKINDAKLIEIKIPVHMPTIQDWDEYEVVQGQIQLKDAYYNYVRLKMTRDTMYFVCIPNEVKTHLTKANVIVAKEINDVPLSKKGHDAAAKKVNTVSDYNLQAFQYQYRAFETSVKPEVHTISFRLNSPYIDSPGKPPNFIS